MEDLSLVELRVSYIKELNLGETKSLEDLINKFETNINEIVKHAKEVKIWENQIIKLVFTDKYEEDVEKQALEWNLKVNLSNGRETKSVSKILSNEYYKKDETIIFFSLEILKLEDNFHKTIYQQLLRVHVDKLLKNQTLAQHKNQISNPKTLIDYTFFYLSIWLPEVFANNFMKILFKDDKSLINENNLFNEFCRKLKRNLFAYNSDEHDNQFRLDRFWQNTSIDFKNLIYNYLEIYIKNGTINIKDDKFRSIVFEIVECILKIKVEMEKNKTFDVAELKNKIIAFFEVFEVYLEEYDENFRITFKKNPKDYFLDTIVDTEPRFVCFLDILGFSNMIEEYETNLSSSILQDIHLAYEESLKILEFNTSAKNNDAVKHLKYQMFSDCVSISIPYFDNQEDFINNLSIISTFINGFQYNMMTKGFFVRGGISIGSFYSNNHIIFSQGLVNSYMLESKKAKYPRILVDEKIMQKLTNYDSRKILNCGLNSVLLKDDKDLVFLNPFNPIVVLESQIDQIKSYLKSDNTFNDQDIELLIKTFYDITISLFEKNLEIIKKVALAQLELIHAQIIMNKETFFNEKREEEFEKYFWIEELLKWNQDENSTGLKFERVF